MTLDIPNYRIIEKLGIGAQSRIFRARCMRTGKDYAVKTVKVQKPEDMKIIEMMRDEHAIGSAIDHPNVRKVYELRMIRHRLRTRGAILFMEYVDGVPISDAQFMGSIDELLGLFLQVAEALRAMHLAGFVHADLKGGNMLVNADRQVKLIDLGQSSPIRVAKPRVQGTADYMAPEQVQLKVLDERTDVFGLGATLYRLLTGEPMKTEMNQTVNMASPSLVKRPGRNNGFGELPASVARLLGDCCAADPNDRPADMGVVINRLELVRASLNRKITGEYEYDDSEYDDYDVDVELDVASDPMDSEDDLLDFVDLDPTSEER